MNKVRKALDRDIVRISEILVFSKRLAYRDIFHNDNISFNIINVDNTEEVIRQAGIDDIYVYDDNILKGMVRINNSEICELYIEPFFQNQGIGKILLDKAENIISRDFETAYLWVLEKNEKARKFYSKNGYIPNGEKKEFSNTKQYLLKYIKEM